MTRIAILEPESLLGTELKEGLASRSGLWHDIRLLTRNPDDVGSVTDGPDGATFIQPVDRDHLEEIDLLFVCPGARPADFVPLPELPGTTVLYLSPAAAPNDALAVVAGVGSGTAYRDAVLLSPHPGVVGLAHLLHPLLELGLREAHATVMQPASIFGRAGIDEALEQARATLTFQTEVPQEVFAARSAFNLYPADIGDRDLSADLRTVLGEAVELSVQAAQAPTLHGVSLGVHLQFADDPGAQEISEALASCPAIEIAEAPEKLGSVDAAGSDQLIVGNIEAGGRNSGTYRLWAVLDNLTLGGAGNALSIAEGLFGS